ncbi:MAG: metallophosphoesterase, partial [Fibrobacteres bacterium]|nr:metallophosphoesterase [Fibrobacterota bacterium]
MSSKRGPLWYRKAKRRLERITTAAVEFAIPAMLHRSIRNSLLNNLDFNIIQLNGFKKGLLPRIAFISDLHADFFVSDKELQTIAKRVMEYKPDLICFGGDLINQYLNELGAVGRMIKKLSAPLGIYAVPGNHDYVKTGELSSWCKRLEKCGVKVLCNEGLRIEYGGSNFWLAGVDDATEGVQDLKAALRGRIKYEPVILLSHHPDIFYHASNAGVTLQLSGHTHGGQVAIGG